ncbi:MAG: polymer-forming cytoskeletal protein [Pseudomonadota bacterium]
MLRNLRNRSAEPNSSSSQSAPDDASDDSKDAGLPVIAAPDESGPADSSIRGRLNRVTRYATHSQDDQDSQEEDAEAASDQEQEQDPVQHEVESSDEDNEQDAMALTDEMIDDTPEEEAAQDQAAPSEPIQQAGPVDDDVAPEDQILTVGRGIRLAAEVCECDTLIVEGQFEAKAKARKIQIPPRGAFKGEAEVAEAEISGAFDGSLTVSGRLTIHGDAVVFGNIQYGEVVIEAGGQIGGEVACLTPRQSAMGVKAA